MLQAPQRTTLSGPALVRLLARLADVEVPESRQSLSDRLSQWLGWTDAIALSSALNGSPPAVAAGARVFGSAEEAECVRLRSSLTKAVVGDSVLATARRDGRAPMQMQRQMHAPKQGAVDAPVDYAVFRQRYQAIQQSMETAIANLRGRLRGMLAARTPALARLAVVDAVMERALGERERNLLGAVPGMLAGHFERLREAEQQALAAAMADSARRADCDTTEAPEASEDAAPVIPGAWLDVFRKDMRSVLLAELEVRFQPVEGLLAALRTR
ncbi:DUF3348 domain-containing protein [Paraburkholderia panacisoli]|uniref:DUF3348 domain-containing protein n=1 Tax=Paraburkholderia panacisoli TaxID=2603818 RepID=A0A5B0GLI5_9BURK|nr:DUF3348 domain-containing protein [Paraburkholderia panacisoli]KAA1004226.1 DUF3348 domain-containing protein [Paraburkholderia panacisoli]